MSRRGSTRAAQPHATRLASPNQLSPALSCQVPPSVVSVIPACRDDVGRCAWREHEPVEVLWPDDGRWYAGVIVKVGRGPRVIPTHGLAIEPTHPL